MDINHVNCWNSANIRGHKIDQAFSRCRSCFILFSFDLLSNNISFLYRSDNGFFCNGGREIDRSQVCDGERNCMGGEDEDEAMCGGTGSGGSGCKYLSGEKGKLCVFFNRSSSWYLKIGRTKFWLLHGFFGNFSKNIILPGSRGPDGGGAEGGTRQEWGLGPDESRGQIAMVGAVREMGVAATWGGRRVRPDGCRDQMGM